MTAYQLFSCSDLNSHSANGLDLLTVAGLELLNVAGLVELLTVTTTVELLPQKKRVSI